MCGVVVKMLKEGIALLLGQKSCGQRSLAGWVSLICTGSQLPYALDGRGTKGQHLTRHGLLYPSKQISALKLFCQQL
ncbi:hypothetical protein PR202_ga07702 [Eleusine coracana subsp. coracana]|uniref:Uncharacterized protein n=1 Tax=Eleusine coracana subsp. coracana TaxID=191504 RepID=A0AAV5BZZ6_ELECO|nr:hypothetical protein PR202_ga07702 [Eleusine coracana subsp. coracana]